MYDEKLVMDNINLIYLVLKRLYLYDKRDDYFDVGMIGLLKGARTYDKTKGIAATTYLYRCIYSELCMTFRKKQPDGMLSLNEIVNSDKEGNPITLEDRIPSDVNIEEEIMKKDQIEHLYIALSKLKERELDIINATYGLNGVKQLTQNQLKEKYNLSQAQISRIKNKSIDKLRKLLKEVNK